MNQLNLAEEELWDMTNAHPCKDQGRHENQMRCEDEEEVDGGILEDRFYNVWSRHGHRAGVQAGPEAEADDNSKCCQVLKLRKTPEVYVTWKCGLAYRRKARYRYIRSRQGGASRTRKGGRAPAESGA